MCHRQLACRQKLKSWRNSIFGYPQQRDAGGRVRTDCVSSQIFIYIGLSDPYLFTCIKLRVIPKENRYFPLFHSFNAL